MALEDASIEAARIAEYRRVLQECPDKVPKDVFYEAMAKSALRYGEAFQCVDNCHPGRGKTTFEVEIIDVGETFSKGLLERPFFVHAATLDNIFQGCLGSTCYSGNCELTNSTMSRLPPDSILASQVRYALAEGKPTTNIEGVFGQPFKLPALDDNSEVTPADLIVIPYQASSRLQGDLTSISERLTRLTKPDSNIFWLLILHAKMRKVRHLH